MANLNDVKDTVESMERTLKSYVDGEGSAKDHIEDFMSFTTTALWNLCEIVENQQTKQ